MFCFKSPYDEDEAELRRDQKRRNKSINATIRRDKDEYRATHRLLLLGKLTCWPDLVLNVLLIACYITNVNYGRASENRFSPKENR